MSFKVKYLIRNLESNLWGLILHLNTYLTMAWKFGSFQPEQTILKTSRSPRPEFAATQDEFALAT